MLYFYHNIRCILAQYYLFLISCRLPYYYERFISILLLLIKLFYYKIQLKKEGILLNTEINTDLHEIKQHGKYAFPFMIYKGKLPEYQHSYPLHWHEEMELIYVISGIGNATINYTSYELHAGDILVIRPLDIHSIAQHQNASFTYYNLLFRLTILEDKHSNLNYEQYFRPLIEHRKKLPPLIQPNHPLSAQLTPHIKELIDNRKNTQPDYELLIKSRLFAIMYYLEQYAISSECEYTNSENENKLKSILLYMDQNYSNPITIKEMAQYCCFSESYFMKFFKHQTGCSFIQYLTNYRLELSSRLLIETNLKITDIALKVGYDNIPYFIRSFHKKYHITPSAYRKNNT